MKKRNILMMAMVAVSLLVGGCSEKKGSVEYYKKHKDEMQAKIKSCTHWKNGDFEYDETIECENAIKTNHGSNPYDNIPGRVIMDPTLKALTGGLK